MSTGLPPVGVIQFGGKTYAAGLFWQAAATLSAADKEAKTLAKEPGIEADLFALRKAETIQFGLGRTQSGHKQGMMAVAACLADALTGTWIGVFRADEGWLFVSVRKGAIMPDGDALYTTEDAARDRLRMDLAVGGWEHVYAPAGWGISQASEGNLEELLSGAKGARLKPVHSSPVMLVASVAVVAVVGFAGWYLFFNKPPPPPVMVGAAPPPPPEPEEPPPPPPPWLGLPPQGDVARACAGVIGRFGVLPGYDLTAVNCDKDGAFGSYKRTFGKISWVKAGSFGGDLQFTSPDDAVIWRQHDQRLSSRISGTLPAKREAVLSWFWEKGQDYMLDVQVSEDAAGPEGTPAPKALNPVDNQIIQFRTLRFSISSRFGSDKVAGLIENLPTMVLDSVTYEPGPGVWSLEGKIYVQ